MTPREKQELINGLTRNRIRFLESGDELGMLCPQCSPQHDKQRLTLSINTDTDKWHCWRCERLKGRRGQIQYLLEVLRLPHLIPVFTDEQVFVDDDAIDRMKRKILFGEDEPESAPFKLELPEGYRTDWKGHVGLVLYRYLTEKRHLSDETIRKYRIGYTVKGNYAGSIVLPVYVNKKLRFWQIRRVLFKGSSKYDSPKVPREGVLYDYESVGSKVIIVEGIFDKLAVGGSCVGLLGKDIHSEQIAMLARKRVKAVTVMLDGDAWKSSLRIARRIADELWGVQHVRAVRLPYGTDPGTLGRAGMTNIRETRRFDP